MERRERESCEDLNEFLQLNDNYIVVHGTENAETALTEVSPNPFVWTRALTLALIEEYKNLHKSVGSAIKSQKHMFQMIAANLNKKFNTLMTWTQASNKMKNLERSYKDVVDNNNATGRKRKDFDFEEQMREFMMKKITLPFF